MAIPNYTYSGVCYSGNGSDKTFALTTSAGESIGYLKKEHIYVSQSANNGATWSALTFNTDYIFTNSGTSIQLTIAPAVGTIVQIKRMTPLDDDYIDFQAGSLLTAEQLNTFDTWQLYIDQELQDQISDASGPVSGAAVKSVTGDQPVLVDNTNAQTPVISVDETVSTDDPNSLTSDTKLMSEKAIDLAFKQYVGSGPATADKNGQIRIDDTGAAPSMFFWKNNAWVQIQSKGDKGDTGPAGPAPGLQTPPAAASNVPLNSDGSLGTATASVSQDPSTSDLKFLFGIPVGQTGATGPQGPTGDGVTYKGLIDATTASEPSGSSNGDLYINTTTGTSSWTGLSSISANDRLIYNGSTNQWDVEPAPPITGALQPGDNVSELVNDAGYITSASIPVNSVNGKTGSVTLNLQDITTQGNTTTESIFIGNGPKITLTASDGTASFAGKITGVTPTSGDAGTTLATKAYVDSSVTTGAVLLDDSGTKQVMQSAGLGLSDGSTENITLNSNGNGSFVGTVSSGTNSSQGQFFVNAPNGSTDAIVVRNATTSGADTAVIKHSGEASFASDVTIGDYTNGDGAKVFSSGSVSVREDTGVGGVVLYNGGLSASNKKVEIKTDGSGNFSNTLLSGDSSFATAYSYMSTSGVGVMANSSTVKNILNIDGTAKFASGNVEVASNGLIDVGGGINSNGASLYPDGRVYGKTVYADGGASGNGILFDGSVSGTGAVFQVTTAGNGTFTGKVTSASTVSSDGATTLATKGYVDAQAGTSGNVVKLNDGGTKQTIYSAGLGISDGSTENITLNPNGDGVFDGDLTIGNYSSNTAGLKIFDNNGATGCYINGSGGNTTAIAVYNGTGSSYPIRLKHNGNATFAGDVDVAGSIDVDGDLDVGDELISKRAAFNFNQGQTGQVVGIYGGSGSSTPVISLKHDGSASFANTIISGDATYVSAYSYVSSGGIGVMANSTTAKFSVSSAGLVNTASDYGFVGDADTYMDHPAADNIGLVAGGKAALTCTTTGTAIGLSSSGNTSAGISYNSGNYIAYRFASPNLIGIIDGTSECTVGTVSDYRLKENVENQESAWDAVKALRPVTFTMKEIETQLAPVDADVPEASTADLVNDPAEEAAVPEPPLNHGFIAHELQEIIPDAVLGEKDGEKYQGLNPAPIVSVLAKALQESLERIETLEAKLAAMEGTGT